MMGTARTRGGWVTISISINALNFLDWPVTWTHVMCQTKKPVRELPLNRVLEVNLLPQHNGRMAKKHFHFCEFVHNYTITHSDTGSGGEMALEYLYNRKNTFLQSVNCQSWSCLSSVVEVRTPWFRWGFTNVFNITMKVLLNSSQDTLQSKV